MSTQVTQDVDHKSSKPVSIFNIILGALGLVIGIAAIVYAFFGATAALDVVNVEGLQEKCRATFDTATAPGWESVNTRVCDSDNSFTCPGGYGTKCDGDEYCSSDGRYCLTCPEEEDFCVDDERETNYFVGGCGADTFSSKYSSKTTVSSARRSGTTPYVYGNPKSYDSERAKSIAKWCPGRSSKTGTTIATTAAPVLTTGAGTCFDRCFQARRIKAASKNRRLATRMCGHNQFTVGCSSEYYRGIFALAQYAGIWATIIGSFLVIIASIPVLCNGLFGFFNKPTLAKVSGGFGIGISICGCCSAFTCAMTTIIFSLLSKAVSDGIELLLSHPTGTPCSPECKTALKQMTTLGLHVHNYYNALIGMLMALMIISLLDIIVVSVSFCYWKRQVTVTVTPTQPQVPMMATVVATQPAAVNVKPAPVVVAAAPAPTVVQPTVVQPTVVQPVVQSS